MAARTHPDPATPSWVLTCDACFARLAGPTSAPWPALWQRAYRLGWRGSREPAGSHRCPDCAGLR